ncbi:MAG: hypothetical protein P8X57_10915 [Cyclobacteriaceae bacterium]
MKKIIILSVLLFSTTVGFAQWGVEYLASNLPQLTVNYEIKERIRPSVSISTDTSFDNLGFEFSGTYDIIDRSEFEVYVGAGLRINGYSGFVIPAGVNVYPFSTDRLGFKIEVAPIIGDDSFLRGGAGLRLRIP